jgi:MFS family permease
MGRKAIFKSSALAWIALALLVVPMFGSYFFDDMFSTVSNIFNDPSMLELGWGQEEYGKYTSGYSILCIFGGLIICGMLLDKWGVRITGSIFVGLMVMGAGISTWAISSGLPPAQSLQIAWVGCMIFGLGSEIAGVAVTRSIAKWFKEGNMAFAMGLQLSIARLGTAAAFIISPILIGEKAGIYTLRETARPAMLGMLLLIVGAVFWAVFVAMDARFDKNRGLMDKRGTAEEDKFRFSDVLKVLGNKNWWLIALLCVFFYSSVIAFKKFAGAILVPRFGVSSQTVGLMATILPFSTVVFAPLFGLMVDKKGQGTRWMLIGAFLAFAAHLLIGFAPSGNPLWGYVSMILLGFSYSLVPAAMWPSVPKVIPEKMLGTAFALIYWVQNLGLWAFKRIAGKLLQDYTPLSAEIMFIAVCVAALVLAFLLLRSSRAHPELALDSPSVKRTKS